MRRLSLLALTLALALATPVSAQSTDGISAFVQAADRFDRLMLQMEPAVPRPHRTDPRLAPIWRDLTDAQLIFGNRRFTAADFDGLGQVIHRTRLLSETFSEYGTQGLDAAAALVRRDRNLLAYQNEVSPIWVVGVEAIARLAETVADLYAEQGETLSDARRAALVRGRAGIERSLSYFLLALSDSRIAAPNRLALSLALGRNAARYPLMFNPMQRNGLRAIAEKKRQRLGPDAARALGPFVAGMASAPCNGLCTIN